MNRIEINNPHTISADISKILSICRSSKVITVSQFSIVLSQDPEKASNLQSTATRDHVVGSRFSHSAFSVYPDSEKVYQDIALWKSLTIQVVHNPLAISRLLISYTVHDPVPISTSHDVSIVQAEKTLWYVPIRIAKMSINLYNFIPFLWKKI